MNPILQPRECLVGRIYYSGVIVACNLFLQRTASLKLRFLLMLNLSLKWNWVTLWLHS